MQAPKKKRRRSPVTARPRLVPVAPADKIADSARHGWVKTISPENAKIESATRAELPLDAYPRINNASPYSNKQKANSKHDYTEDRKPNQPKYPCGINAGDLNPDGSFSSRTMPCINHDFNSDMSTTTGKYIEFNGARSQFSDELPPAPTMLSLRHPGHMEIQTEYVSAPIRYDSKKPETHFPFFDTSGPLQYDVNVTSQIPAKHKRKRRDKKATSQKWAVSQRFVKFICSDWGGQKFNSGYFIYADDFEEDKDIDGALAITATSNNLYLNPPFKEILVHLHHWFNLALRNNRSYVIVSPVLLDSAEWKFFANSDYTVTVFFRNPVSFEDIRNNYQRPGTCPKQICLIFLNVSGDNVIVENDLDGVFVFTNNWYRDLKCQPINKPETLKWDKVPDLIYDYKDAQKDLIFSQRSSFDFSDLKPSVLPSVDSNLFTPLSPLWDSHMSPLLKRYFGDSFTPRYRESISLARSEHLLKIHEGQFYSAGPNLCNLCGSENHPTHACFLRIPSVSDLGLIHRYDVEMYKYLVSNFPFFDEIHAIPGESKAKTSRRIRSTVSLRERCFISFTNKHFETLRPKVKWPWKLSGFSQIRNNLPHHVALAKPLWIIIGCAFGIHYPYLQLPPIRTIGHVPPTVDKDMFQICCKETNRGTPDISPVLRLLFIKQLFLRLLLINQV